jgi:uncharacterized protein with von Willebrand factor type A (vWA) domain
MEEQIIKFISALRSAGVRISLAESADAFSAIDQLGIKHRDTFRLSLRTTLVKDSRNLPIFENFFPIYFESPRQASMMNLSNEFKPAEMDMLAQALHQFSDRTRQMIERLLSGEELTPDELNRLAKFVGLSQADDLSYQEWIVQRMKKVMRFQQVRDALQELVEILTEIGLDEERGEQLRQMILHNQQGFEDQLRRLVGQRIADNMSQPPLMMV